MSRIRSVHQLDGLIALNNKNCIAVFSDFDSAVLFSAHHPAWEVHIHLVLPRTQQTPPTSAITLTERYTEPVEVSAYLTDGEKVYKQPVFTPKRLGLSTLPLSDTHPCSSYQIVSEAILTNPAS